MHVSVPDDLLQCTTIPIPKGHNATRSSADNYRGITLGYRNRIIAASTEAQLR